MMTENPTSTQGRTHFDVRIASMGTMPLPGPEVYWMSAWDEWFDATFWMVVARFGENVVVINTGPPADLTALNELWASAHPSGRMQYSRREGDDAVDALARIGIAPEEVTHVILTPLVGYTSGALGSFPNARIVISRRGWIEDVLAPPLPRHVPREIFVADDLLDWLLHEGASRLDLVDGTQEILPGVRAIECGVHHRSSLVVEIDTAEGVFAATDAAFAYENVEKNINLGIGESYAEAMRTYAYLRENADRVLPLYDSRAPERLGAGILIPPGQGATGSTGAGE